MPDKKIKVVFMGTPEFALPPLEALLNDKDVEVQTVITREDKRTGRRKVITPPPVKVFAMLRNIPVLQPPSLKNSPEIVTLIKGLKPDFLVVVAFGQILPPEILAIPAYCCINLHGSLLPKYRGASPVEEALLHGDSETGVTFIKMNEKLDSGDIYLIQRIQIKPDDNAIILREKLSRLGAALLPYLLKDIKEGLVNPIPQNHAKASYCRKISREDGLIDLESMTAAQILNRIRAYSPWPGCFIIINKKRLKILEALMDEDSEKARKTAAGEAVLLDKNEIGLGTKKGLLIPKTVQLEGKSAMSVQDFLRGNPDFFKKPDASAR